MCEKQLVLDDFGSYLMVDFMLFNNLRKTNSRRWIFKGETAPHRTAPHQIIIVKSVRLVEGTIVRMYRHKQLTASSASTLSLFCCRHMTTTRTAAV